jgi:hypothetical protein
MQGTKSGICMQKHINKKDSKKRASDKKKIVKMTKDEKVDIY